MAKQLKDREVVEMAERRKAVKAQLKRFARDNGIRTFRPKRVKEAFERAATMKFETERERFARKEREIFAGLAGK